MSWEGHYQAICEKGHLGDYPALMVDPPGQCSKCGLKIVWANMVDDTNGCYPMDAAGHCACGSIQLKPNAGYICKECGQFSVTYDIPPEGALPHRVPKMEGDWVDFKEWLDLGGEA